MKNLILVTSPPACGKTFVSKAIARNIKPMVYLDKDTLIVLSKQIFKVANQEYNRSSDFSRRISVTTSITLFSILPTRRLSMQTMF